MDVVDDREAIQALEQTLLNAVKAGDAAGVMLAWDDEGGMMPPHHPSVRGREEIEAYFRQLLSAARLQFTFTASEITIAGDMAVERIEYRAEIWRGGARKPSVTAGKGLHVYRRRASGWKLVHDIWNDDAPPLTT